MKDKKEKKDINDPRWEDLKINNQSDFRTLFNSSMRNVEKLERKLKQMAARYKAMEEELEKRDD